MTTPNTQGASWEEEFDRMWDYDPCWMTPEKEQIKNYIREVASKERAEGERRGAEKERERIFRDMTKYQFRYEITPDEIKNLRENLIHLDENMRRDGFCEIADRIFNDKMYRMGAPKSDNVVKEYTVYVYKPHKNEATLPADSTGCGTFHTDPGAGWTPCGDCGKRRDSRPDSTEV